MVTVFIVIFFIVAISLTFYRMRRGGPGPQVNWVPKGLRPKLNQKYKKAGWQEPFADDGSRNPDRDAL